LHGDHHRARQTEEDHFMKMRTLLAPAAVVLAMSLAGCGSPNDPSAQAGTETFSGTVAIGQTAAHNFSTAADGPASVTITSLAPDSAVPVGLAIGNPGNNGACSAFAFLQAARLGITLPGTLSKGTYCVMIYDVGNLTVTNTYTLTVTHS
jgi:hypothetical protein